MRETSPPPRSPNVTERALAAKLARAEREAAALRANLHKRKSQARARDLPPEPPVVPPHDR
jgi:hypothetical protein